VETEDGVEDVRQKTEVRLAGCRRVGVSACRRVGVSACRRDGKHRKMLLYSSINPASFRWRLIFPLNFFSSIRLAFEAAVGFVGFRSGFSVRAAATSLYNLSSAFCLF
jgi:hypothetical protein